MKCVQHMLVLIVQQLVFNIQTLKGQLVEPIKTTNVQNLRCMTTWIIKK